MIRACSTLLRRRTQVVCLVQPRARALCDKPSKATTTTSTPSDASRPTAEEVRNLAESARFQQKMWDTFVPERSVKFGDQRFWVLVGIIAILHTYNNWRERNKPAEIDLPPDAVRRLPDGRLLMADGSITAKGVDDGKHEHKLHKPKEPDTRVISRLRDSL